MASEQPDPARILSPAQIAELTAWVKSGAMWERHVRADISSLIETITALRQQVETLRQELETRRECGLALVGCADLWATRALKAEAQLAALSAAQEQMKDRWRAQASENIASPDAIIRNGETLVLLKCACELEALSSSLILR